MYGHVPTTEGPQTMPACPGNGLEYFGRGYMTRLKKTYLNAIVGTSSYGGGRLKLNLEGCAQVCIDHGPECRSVEWKVNTKCDACSAFDSGKCEIKIYSMLDTAIKPNTGGWLIRSKELFEHASREPFTVPPFSSLHF